MEEELINVELSKNELLIFVKALITLNAVNGVVDKELTDLVTKISKISSNVE